MSAPFVSVIIPSYESHSTLACCLVAIESQTFEDREVILVDSGPSDACERIVRHGFPGVRLLRSGTRLRQQAARNLGAEQARGQVLVFTDPDIYAPRDWLQRLLAAFELGHRVVVGSIACAGHRWLDRGVHLCKFSPCLAGGAPRAIEIAWSGNLLCAKALFHAVGGFPPDVIQGDLVLGRRLRRAGEQIWLAPEAVVFHDHGQVGWGAYLRERYARGRECGTLAAHGEILQESPGRMMMLARGLGAGLLPLQVARASWKVFRAARRAHLTRDFLSTYPAIAAGLAFWLSGIAVGHLDAWRQKRA